MHCTNRTVYINLVCIHFKINVVPLAFTVYIVLQNVQFVHCALYKSYSLYRPCVRALKNKCSPFTVHCSAKCTICTLYSIHCKNRTVYIQYTIHLACVHLIINVVPLLCT